MEEQPTMEWPIHIKRKGMRLAETAGLQYRQGGSQRLSPSSQQSEDGRHCTKIGGARSAFSAPSWGCIFDSGVQTSDAYDADSAALATNSKACYCAPGW